MNRYLKSMIASCCVTAFGVAPCYATEAVSEDSLIPVAKAGIIPETAVESEKTEETGKCCDKSAYTGAYVAAGFGFDKARTQASMIPGAGVENSADLAKNHFRRPMLSLAAGYGDFITDSFYLGAELGVDFLLNKTTVQDIGNILDLRHKVRGMNTSFSIRLGQRLSCCDALVYEKLGLVIQDSKFYGKLIGDDKIETRRIAPLIGFGIEKNLYQNCNLRFEADYHLEASKKRTNVTTYDGESGDEIGQADIMKHRVRGCAARLLFTYNFRISEEENVEQPTND